MSSVEGKNRSMLIIDDNEAIHRDFRKILASTESGELDAIEAAFFGEDAPEAVRVHFSIDSAFQGQEGLEKLVEARRRGGRYAVAFVDMRMPPGWDGVETIERLWQEDPELQVVICTAYSDYAWNEIVSRLGETDQLLILKKPFDDVEVRQMALALTEKSYMTRQARLRMEELQRLVEARTHKLENEVAQRRRTEQTLDEREQQLRHAQKMEAVGTLAGGIAHEFNNLLQAIGGYTRFAMQEIHAGCTAYQDLREVSNAVHRAADLTARLLGFSRQRHLKRELVNAETVVGELTKMLRPILSENIELEVSSNGHGAQFHGDAEEIKQVLLNLCINARDAMPDGGKLTLTTETASLSEDACSMIPHTRPGRHMVISVTDTGQGMSPDVRGKVFEPFFTTKEVRKGTGLGLSTAYGIIQQHGGAIHVYSTLNQGTTFKVYLPASNETAPPRRPHTRDEPEHAPAGDGEAVLLAEDEPMVLNLSQRALERAGYVVYAATDGDQAIRLIEEHAEEISVAVLDVVMPRRGGREVHEFLVKTKPEVQVIFCTGYDPQGEQADLELGGRTQLMIKPFDASDLLRAVRECLTNSEDDRRQKRRERREALTAQRAERPV